MKKQLILLATMLSLFSCSNDAIKSKTPIVETPIDEPNRIYVSFSNQIGWIHFTDKMDYVTDEFGFCHILKHDESNNPEGIFFLGQNENDFINKSDFKDGEKVLFSYSLIDSFPKSTTDIIMKYNEEKEDKIKKIPATCKKQKDGTYSLLTEDNLTLPTYRPAFTDSFYTADFVKTEPKDNSKYIAYVVTKTKNQRDENAVLLAIEMT